MDQDDDVNEREWKRAENWAPWGTYHSPHDSRVWVPKRNRATGWTVNTAHGGGRLALAALIGIPLLILLATALFVILGSR
ncbi:MAG TPA: DUF5808 domain-containing protein [Vicinamibacterales bacterium]|jgi:uncharacterized membrane protein|nr:DUF5808 domain-containing protein [Vicinamibacterales bacterium]